MSPVRICFPPLVSKQTALTFSDVKIECQSLFLPSPPFPPSKQQKKTFLSLTHLQLIFLNYLHSFSRDSGCGLMVVFKGGSYASPLVYPAAEPLYSINPLPTLQAGDITDIFPFKGLLFLFRLILFCFSFFPPSCSPFFFFFFRQLHHFICDCFGSIPDNYKQVCFYFLLKFIFSNFTHPPLYL